MSDAGQTAPEEFNRTQRGAFIVGALGLGLSAVAAYFFPHHFFRGYLMGWVFWTGIAAGSLAITMLNWLTGGAWGVVIRRFCEAAARTLPIMLLLFIPLAFGLHELYEWTHEEEVAHDVLLQHKQGYLNVPFFLLRTAIYLGIWSWLAYSLSRMSESHGETGDPLLADRIRQRCSWGLLLFVLTITFAGYDWLMTLEPHWFSSVFGLLVGAGLLLTALAAMVVVLTSLLQREPLAGLVTRDILNDLGSLLLAFTMIWAYLQLSQFLIIWSANIPEEAFWYVKRSEGSWSWIPVALAIFHFMVPFFLLLSREVRSDPRRLTMMGIYLVVVHFFDLFWIVVPTFEAGQFALHFLDLLVPIGLGGLWVALFIWQLKGRTLLPLVEIPRLEERAHHAH